MVNENGTTEVGKIVSSNGIKIKQAPLPHIVLIQNAKITAKKSKIVLITILKLIYGL